MWIQLFVCYHKDGDFINSNPLIPLFIGSAETKSLNISKDNTGDNIADKNSNYCELTAVYWIWKNISTDFVGLFHYRRFLNFKSDVTKFHYFSSSFAKKYGITEKNIEKILQTCDVILPKKAYLDPVHSSISSPLYLAMETQSLSPLPLSVTAMH